MRKVRRIDTHTKRPISYREKIQLGCCLMREAKFPSIIASPSRVVGARDKILAFSPSSSDNEIGSASTMNRYVQLWISEPLLIAGYTTLLIYIYLWFELSPDSHYTPESSSILNPSEVAKMISYLGRQTYKLARSNGGSCNNYEGFLCRLFWCHTACETFTRATRTRWKNKRYTSTSICRVILIWPEQVCTLQIQAV